MAFGAKEVKDLREKTGAGMMDCKKALTEVDGDMEKAVDWLRTKGLAQAAKKQSRIAAEGEVYSIVEGNEGVLVEVNCETDFVSKGDDFKNFVKNVAMTILKNKPADIEALKNAKSSKGITLMEEIQELTMKLGEKIDIRRFELISVSNGGLGTYVHGGKIGVLCKFDADGKITGNDKFEELSKDICMHIAAAAPVFVNANEIDEAYKKREADVYEAQLKEQGKPADMIPNIIKGKLSKLAKEVCLLEQPFVKDPDVTISKLVANAASEIGAKVNVASFLKFNLGEGIEKKVDNLADEVAKMTNA